MNDEQRTPVQAGANLYSLAEMFADALDKIMRIEWSRDGAIEASKIAREALEKGEGR